MATSRARQVFISHSSEDKALARQVAATCTLRGLPIFLDEQSIMPGKDYQEVIMDAVSMSAAMVVLLSRDSVKSKDVLREIALAENAGLPVLPFAVDSLVFPRDYPKSTHYRLMHYQIGAYPGAEAAVDLVERVLGDPEPGEDSDGSAIPAPNSGLVRDRRHWVGHWVKCIETGGQSRNFLVEIRPDGTATESHLFGDPDDRWSAYWKPLPDEGGAPAVAYWCDLDHGYYLTRAVERPDGTFWGSETAHPAGQPNGSVLWTTRVVFVRVK